MTPEAFVAVASGLAMVKAKTAFGAVRLAVSGKTFATVGWPDANWAVIKLAATDQTALLAQSDALRSEPGRRGHKGVTLVRLAGVSEPIAGRVLLAAWRHATASGESIAKTG